MKQAGIGLSLYGLLMIPPVVHFLESVMLFHMLVQLPLLIVAGWLMGGIFIGKFINFFTKWNASGIPGILLFIIITMYWMLPRVLDEAVSLWYMELFKFISLPFLAGLCLRDSWCKLKIVGKSFVYLNYLPMFGLMAWLYIDTPIQICNNYLEDQQKVLGWGFLFITICMIIYILQQVFSDQSETPNH
ncbi:hypothetical protein GCM10011409_34290 [Lentibacillus populi]|uniref:Uncharacterized protein n=1 Tax=Lentibacillus populi TaxID=1827502 RepID=A0A9W5U163_9BACI|nr:MULTISPECIES: hypothetical protein [Bacillaceae]MBT2216121.1 hypothetical protein [Virgibacillus dakarensis]GGB53800.1 hypothetical protein GCM10011409_34290 [Lentibacillus populi]